MVKRRTEGRKPTKAQKNGWFSFLDFRGCTINEKQVTRTKNNFTFLLNYNGTFAGNYPTKKEVQEALKIVNTRFRLNDFKDKEALKAWLDYEATLQRGAASYVHYRTSRNPGARSGHTRMAQLKNACLAALEDNCGTSGTSDAKMEVDCGEPSPETGHEFAELAMNVWNQVLLKRTRQEQHPQEKLKQKKENGICHR